MKANILNEQPATIDMKPVESAKKLMMDAMTESLSRIRTGSDVILEKVVWRKQLKSSSEWNYCPYCKQRARRSDGANWKQSLHPLWMTTYAVFIRIDKTHGRWIQESRYECPVCKGIDGKPRTITEDDFLACRPVEPNYAKHDVDISRIDFSNPSERAMFLAGSGI
ncbi:MAG: hypothetical protein IJ717_00995 [Treponema sp.]|nr:hypothetical protein [Treponema sp.]